MEGSAAIVLDVPAIHQNVESIRGIALQTSNRGQCGLYASNVPNLPADDRIFGTPLELKQGRQLHITHSGNTGSA